MFEFINHIPNNIGWVIVGIIGCLCAEMFILLINTCIDAIKERLLPDYQEEGNSNENL